jgi:glucans biosynthesis protein
MLSKIGGLVSPETFAALVKIFDSTWAAVEASGKLSAQETEAARNEIAKLVMEQADRPDLADARHIQSEILQLFWQSRKPGPRCVERPTFVGSSDMILSRRHLLLLLLAVPSLGLTPAAVGGRSARISRGPAQPFKKEHVESLARQLAASPFAGHRYVTPEWMDLHYEQYQQIRFRHEAALWHGTSIPFKAEFLLPGMLYHIPVEIFVVEGDKARPLQFSMQLYRSDFPMPRLDPTGAGGFSGVRLLSAPHRRDGLAEFAVFQGGSYFRAIGAGQKYGLSARGLALATADPDGEEFPVFRSFWLETPERGDGIRLHALMDSQSVTGAYTFEVRPGGTTVVDVDATLFPRVDLDKVGIAPMSSMFQFNQTNHWKFDDFRSGVHDSDGLLIANGAGEWLWRPLANPAQLQVSAFLDANPLGFGLLQRERDFNRFGDLVARYDKRPSLWVEPRDDWGRGAVFLVEVPTNTEVNDNIVAFWRPEKPLPAGRKHRLQYRLSWGWGSLKRSELAPVLSTRLGRHQFGGLMAAIDFAPHPELTAAQVKADVSVRHGRLQGAWIQNNEQTGGLRLTFGFGPESAVALELRAQLRKRGVPKTEVWLYRWTA